MAETTTTGCFGKRERTMSATRPMAEVDSRELPPNFITIIE
jgi:hypothetical protein